MRSQPGNGRAQSPNRAVASPSAVPGARRFKLSRSVLGMVVVAREVSLDAGHPPAQVGGLCSSGAPAPQIHGQLAGYRHHGFFPRRLGGSDIAQYSLPFLDQLAIRLPQDHPPGQFHPRGAQAHVAVFGDRQQMMAVAAGTDATAQSGIAAHLPPIGETVPVAHLTFHHGIRQAAQTLGTSGRGGGLQRQGGRVQFGGQRGQQAVGKSPAARPASWAV